MTSDGYTVTTNQNVGNLESEGIDINATYVKGLGGKGTLSVNLIGTILMHSKIDTGLYQYDCKGYFGNQCGVPTPGWRHLIRFSWEAPFKTTFSFGWRLVGSVTNDDGSPNNALANPSLVDLEKANDIYTIPNWNLFDLSINHKLTKHYTLLFGIDNLFDKEPPLAPGSSPNDYGTGFYGTYDSLGRYVFGGIQFTF